MNQSQQERFSRPPQPAAFARVTDPSTSKAAARSIEETLGELEALCLAEIRKSSSGLTTEELAARLRLSLVTVSPRMRPLCRRGLIVANGKRENRSGHKAIVWRAP